MKRMLSVLLASILLLALLPCASAEEEREILKSGNFRYAVLDDGTVEITRWIANGYSDRLTSLEPMLDGKKVTRIGDYAFYREYTVKTFEIPDGVTSIGDHAFGNCQNLTAVTIPDSVSQMGVNPFESSQVLTGIVVSPTNPYFATIDGVLYEKATKKLVCYPCAFSATEFAIPQGIAAIGDYAFANSRFNAVTIPDSVASIGDHAFYGCDLTAVTIPYGVTSIGDYAFAACDLAAVTIPDSVTRIGDFAFEWCIGITSVTIPDSVSEIGTNPFHYCDQLTGINVSPTHPYFTTIDGALCEKATNRLVCCLYAIGAKKFTVPQGTAAIGDYAFVNSGFNAVTIPDSVTSIGDHAFESCRDLTDVMIPDSVTSVGDHAFEGCNKLTAVTIPDSVTSIGESAFFNCWNLTAVTIPDSVTFIGADAFSVKNYDSDWKYTNPNISLIIPYGGYAEAYCKENGVNYTYQSNDDWLSD